MEEKKRKKWDDHIAKCKVYLRRKNYPNEVLPYGFHYESEIAIDDYLKELEIKVKNLHEWMRRNRDKHTKVQFIMPKDEPLRDQHGDLLNEKVTVTIPIHHKRSKMTWGTLISVILGGIVGTVLFQLRHRR